jgi:hypothetical protein
MLADVFNRRFFNLIMQPPGNIKVFLLSYRYAPNPFRGVAHPRELGKDAQGRAQALRKFGNYALGKGPYWN